MTHDLIPKYTLKINGGIYPKERTQMFTGTLFILTPNLETTQSQSISEFLNNCVFSIAKNPTQNKNGYY
jgi:hypothetical protein